MESYYEILLYNNKLIDYRSDKLNDYDNWIRDRIKENGYATVGVDNIYNSRKVIYLFNFDFIFNDLHFMSCLKKELIIQMRNTIIDGL